MRDADKTKEQLLREMEAIRQRLAELEAQEAESKRAEQVLRNLEERCRTLLEETPLGIMSVDIKGKITYVNNAILENTGYSIDDLVGKNAFRLGLVTSESLSLMRRRLREKLMGEPPSPLIIQFKCKDGEWIWLEIRGKLLQKHGLPIGVQIIGENITERKQMEEALRESDERIRAILDASPDVMHLLDINGIILSANAGSAKRLGLEVDDLLGKSVFDYDTSVVIL